jgi:CDP-glucose 4,6-dehydratase
MHFLITGHTGFKGAWLTLLLRQRGHLVSGISLNPAENSLFELADVSNSLQYDIRFDIRSTETLANHFQAIKPDVIIHLAAQSLVRESYRDPVTTFETNVMGTVNVLRASRSLQSLSAQLIITTDKVYENVSKSSGYIESDPLGGKDPYSASKAMADIATQSWLSSFSNPPTAIARAGNVIGGGDVCTDRLIPDLVKSYSHGQVPKLRAPNSVRPWQHVLDCLNGYLALVDEILNSKIGGAWNFGPSESSLRSVANVSDLAGTIWGVEAKWELDLDNHPQEAQLLSLNSEKAREQLGWKEKLSFEESIEWTMNWYKNVANGANPLEECLKDIARFEAIQLK